MHGDRPLAYLSLAFTHYFTGAAADAFLYKVTNLLIHLLNAGLIYWLSLLLLDRLHQKRSGSNSELMALLPPIIAMCWAIHPLQLTSVLYVVQRMTSLSALCVLIGLIAFTIGRQMLSTRERRGILLVWGGILGGSIVGFGFKENAILILLYVAVIEFVFFHGEWKKPALRRRLLFIYGVPTLLLTFAATVWLSLHTASFTKAYALLEFTLDQRLLTEARVLWFYLSLIVFPASNRFALFHDDIPISSGLLIPWTTLPAVIALIAIAVIAFLARRKLPVLSFAVLWFLAGHSMESSFIGLELVHEHRNYLPSLGPIFGLTYGLSSVLRNTRPALLCAIYLLLVLALCITTYTLARVWAHENTLVEFLLRNHPASAKTNVMAADWNLVERKQPLPALWHYARAATLQSEETAYLIRAVYVSARTEFTTGPTPVSIQLKGLPDTDWVVTQDGNRLRIRATEKTLTQISSQLQLQPVHDRTAAALEEIVNCIDHRPVNCGYLLEQTTTWYRLAINNVRSNDHIRAKLLTQLVRLQLEKRNFADALAYARQARTLDPASPALATMEANVLLLAGDIDGAAAILDKLSGDSPSLTPDERAAVNDLQHALTRERLSGNGKTGRSR